MKKALSIMKKNLKSQRGSEILQVILVAGVLLVLVVTLFYPQVEALFTSIATKISTWFESTGSQVFKA